VRESAAAERSTCRAQVVTVGAVLGPDRRRPWSSDLLLPAHRGSQMWSMYRELGVHDRDQVLARARELGPLEG
jgi:hypothetical protein